MEREDRSHKESHQPPSFEVFDRALAAVITACDRLIAATWNQDLVRAELAARAAVASWRQAREALRRLEPAHGLRGPRWQIAAFALAANRRATSDALDRTRRMLADPSLQQVLAHLAQTLALAATDRTHPTSAEPTG